MHVRIFALAVILVLLSGCGDCGEDPPGDPSPDATDVMDTLADTPEDTRDEDVSDTTDAADTADTQDADTADASPSTATVTVTWGGEGAVGVRVLAHNPDAAVTADVNTDSNGQAEVEVTDGSMITLIDALPNDYTRYLTLTDIAPGDTIDLDFAANTAPNRTLDIDLPGSATNAARYEIWAGCNYRSVLDSSSAVTVGIRPPCSEDATDILALARQSDDTLVAYTSAENVQTTGGTTNVTLDAWKTDLVSADLEFTGLPTTAGLAYDAGFYLQQDPQRWRVGRAGGQTNSATSVQETRSVPPNIGEELVVAYTLRHPNSTNNDPIRTSGADFVSDRSSASSTVVTGEQLMPLVSSITVQNRDTARPAAEWDTTPVVTGGKSAAEADASLTRVIWTGMTPTSTHPNGPPGESPGISPSAVNIWVILGPNDQQSLRFPALPDDINTPAEGTNNAVSAGLVDARDIDGFAEFKATPDVADLFSVVGAPFYPGLSIRESRAAE